MAEPTDEKDAALAAEAERLAQRVKDENAAGKRKSSAKTQLRNSLIVARTAQGVTAEVVAAEVKVTRRTVERVLADHRSLRSPLEETPMKLLEDLATGYQLSIGDYEAMAMAYFDDHPTAALGAKKAADETRQRLVMLLSDLGKLPSDLASFRSEMEMERLGKEMNVMMRRLAAGEADVHEAVEFFRGMIAGLGTGKAAPEPVED